MEKVYFAQNETWINTKTEIGDPNYVGNDLRNILSTIIGGDGFHLEFLDSSEKRTYFIISDNTDIKQIFEEWSERKNYKLIFESCSNPLL